MSQSKLRGHCYCGAVRFIINGEPKGIAHCHCESCRRHSASAVATFASFYVDQIDFSHAQPAIHVTDDGVKRSFCGECGSPISYQSAQFENEIDMYLGIFNHPEDLRPQSHVFYREHIAWLNIDDGLPREEGFSKIE